MHWGNPPSPRAGCVNGGCGALTELRERKREPAFPEAAEEKGRKGKETARTNIFLEEEEK